jgi:phosphoribosyl 1,2-cyclic phosphate phosphodiesterase
MKFTFLGTGTSQGDPIIGCKCKVCSSIDFKDQRLRTSGLIETKNGSYCIDAGPDFRQQMLRERIDQLDAILFTHEHKDHTAGLDDVRAFNYLTKKDFPIYGEERVINQIKKEFAYAFSENPYPGVPLIETHYINENEVIELKGDKIETIRVLHHKLPVLGFKIDNFAYITDANYISEEEKKKLKNLDVLVLNALRKEEHISHFTLEGALELITELQPKKTYLTHLSHQMGRHADVQKELPEKVFIAYDGLQINL